MGKQIISFKYKGNVYQFDRPYIPELCHTTLQWVRKCYREIGAKKKEITCKQITCTDWGFWCGYID